MPRLADIMATVQARHIKLWSAGKLLNWELAAYELVQLKASLEDAATLYPGIPVTDVTTMVVPVDSIAAAVAAKDGAKFSKGFNELTSGCNACHQNMGRSFVTIQVPVASPFSNQVFAPPRHPQEKK